ncbi:helix-turn-helix domain-containing protein [Actinokineospora guangxiensis]|uniref:Helix-turn-helix domain-containing protein n=1 Tax=Actinokineospora guangxiensis TaxID=1490288 RepID=A0ABW0EED6_9PSEU
MDRVPTIRSRELGEALRKALKAAGLTGQEASRRLGWSPSKVSRLLLGARGASERDVSSLLVLCGVNGDERSRLLSLCRDPGAGAWVQQLGRLPTQLKTLVDHENQACGIDEFEPTLVPGLLQTVDYAQAIVRANSNVPAREVDERVIARTARQQLFRRARPPRFTFYVHEFALRLPIGGPEIMAEQLNHLVRMAGRDNIALRVVPAAVGAHAALAGAFRLMEFPHYKPIVYLESENSSLFLERPEEIAAYRGILSALADTALGAGESRQLVAGLARELYADGEDNGVL